MIGDLQDMVRRLVAVLPARWFGDVAPLRDALLSGIGAAWTSIYSLITVVLEQTRISTAESTFLDSAAFDFFGSMFLRRPDETDISFRSRIAAEMLRPKATRAALVAELLGLTGQAPLIFEPALPCDTGGYSAGGVGYGVAGGWGNLELPFQFFITAKRPLGVGIAYFAGYGSGGVPVYGSLSLVASPVLDSDIEAAIVSTIPAATTAWLRITG